MARHGALLHNNNGVWFTYLGRNDGRSVRASCKERVTHATAAEAAAAKKRAEATAQGGFGLVAVAGGNYPAGRTT